MSKKSFAVEGPFAFACIDNSAPKGHMHRNCNNFDTDTQWTKEHLNTTHTITCYANVYLSCSTSRPIISCNRQNIGHFIIVRSQSIWILFGAGRSQYFYFFISGTGHKGQICNLQGFLAKCCFHLKFSSDSEHMDNVSWIALNPFKMLFSSPHVSWIVLCCLILPAKPLLSTGIISIIPGKNRPTSCILVAKSQLATRNRREYDERRPPQPLGTFVRPRSKLIQNWRQILR